MNNSKQLLKSIAYWTLPPGIQNNLPGIYRRTIKKLTNINLAEVEMLAKKNSLLKNKHHGERCFILATGPSIKEQDLSLLKGEICIGVSHFFLHKDIKIIRPQYHVLAPYHYPFNFDTLTKVFDGLNEHYSEDVNYFFGHTHYEYSIFNFLKENPQVRKKNTYFINYCYSQVLNEHNYKNNNIWNICNSPFAIRTVIYIAIQIALYMGCKQIYLLGCDHDYLNDTNRVTNHHFYKEEDGISDAEHLSYFTTERWFEEYYLRWHQYRLMREYAELKGCQIFNATKGGMLDVFRRVDLSKLLQDK
ncbi:hypothetical protein RIVM261_067620 [Rivularia sp. IAM M-261]|nr:hypothetical protein RIVM261_067620 [Rivularia sp. IAM M-261]